MKESRKCNYTTMLGHTVKGLAPGLFIADRLHLLAVSSTAIGGEGKASGTR